MGLGGFATDGTPKDVSAASSIPAANPVAIATIQLGGVNPMTPETNLDVIVTSQTSDQVLSLMGDGTGEFPGAGSNYTAMLSATNPNPSAIAVGLLNTDSPNPNNVAEPDILIANIGPDQVFPAFGRTDGQAFDFGGVLATGTTSDPVGLALGDLDGDGDQDGISANSGTANATVITYDGGGATNVDTSHPVGTSPRSVSTGGFDADGRSDAAVANYGSNSVTVLTSLQPGPQPQATPPAANPPAPAPTPAVPAKKCKKKKGKGKPKAAAAAKKCKKKKRKA